MVRRQTLIIILFVLLTSFWWWKAVSLIKNYHPVIQPVWQISNVEIEILNKYRGLNGTGTYGKILGTVNYNKPVLILNKLLTNFHQLADINYYFFANHPRERAGYFEIEKFSWLLLPFFIYGLLTLPSQKRIFKFTLVYFIVISVGLSAIGLMDNLSTILLAPVIALIIAVGFEKIFFIK